MPRPLPQLILILLLVGGSATAAFAAPSNTSFETVTSIKPLQLIASAITDGVSTPELLIPATQSPHHFSLRPSNMQNLSEAALVVWVGPSLETFLIDLFDQFSQATTVVTTGDLPGMTLYPLSGHSHGHEDEEHSHQPEDSVDGHVWLDTQNALLIAQQIATELSRLDASNASRYQANLERFEGQIQQHEARSRRALDAVRNASYAVYHNAFQYFEKQHGLEADIILVENLEIQPGIRHMLEMRRQLAEVEPVCLFEDVSSNASTVQTMLGDQSPQRVRADLLGADISPGPDGYIQLMDNLTTAFADCLDGNTTQE